MQQHVSYLVRLWRMGETDPSGHTTVSGQGLDANPHLRITALDPRTGAQWGFSEWSQLLAFLQAQIQVPQVELEMDTQIQPLRHKPQQEVQHVPSRQKISDRARRRRARHSV